MVVEPERYLPGSTPETPEERAARLRLMSAAAEAEEMFGVDELERYAEGLRREWAQVQVGEVGVGGGRLLVMDPAYLRHLDQAAFDRISEVARSTPAGRTVSFPSGGDGMAAVAPAHFDGSYPVFVTLVDDDGMGEVATKLEIDLRPQG